MDYWLGNETNIPVLQYSNNLTQEAEPWHERSSNRSL